MSTHEIKIYGTSDDLIEIEGSIREEFALPFALPSEYDGVYVCCSDGTALRISYGEEGVWRLTLVRKGSAEFHKFESPVSDDDVYSDVVTLRGTIDWVVLGVDLALGELCQEHPTRQMNQQPTAKRNNGG